MNSVASTLNRVTGMEFNNQISVLTPNNWNTWKHDMQVLLMHYGCWQFIIQTKPEQPDEEATYKEKLDLQLHSVAVGVSSRPKLTGIVRGKAFLHILRRRRIGCPDSRKRTL
ncbi:uncharacterized protein TNCV_3358301 [Trichonephila clavipes]|nr:uncharacterized protein TNCV_3358301 [Trichonephila clavipes]